MGGTDLRPERLLLGALGRNPAMDVKILLNRMVLDGHLIGASLILPGLGLVIAIIGGIAMAFGALTDVDDVQDYFPNATLPDTKIRGATTSVFGPTHAKLAIVDGATAVSIASPFDQGYFGDAEHAIDDPRRGNKDTVPIHDVSLVVTGPAVFDLHELYRLPVQNKQNCWYLANMDDEPVSMMDRPWYTDSLAGATPRGQECRRHRTHQRRCVVRSLQCVRTDKLDWTNGHIESFVDLFRAPCLR